MRESIVFDKDGPMEEDMHSDTDCCMDVFCVKHTIVHLNIVQSHSITCTHTLAKARPEVVVLMVWGRGWVRWFDLSEVALYSLDNLFLFETSFGR